MTELSDICPVCGMAVNVEVPVLEHHKMHFYFCSTQCRETFAVHPSLYSSKAGKEKNVVLKQRTMSVSEPLSDEVTELLIPYLMEVMGVKKVTVEGGKVNIIYDLLQVTELQIEKVLVDVGVELGSGWLERLCRAWVHNSEENELENLAPAAAPCCNKPPPRI
ncbi:MAG: hypothetical protein L3J70_08365 [Gammaproteobacteria bacterium]|nr:hypothetical protein [Gammaproteobacteria bacterium]